MVCVLCIIFLYYIALNIFCCVPFRCLLLCVGMCVCMCVLSSLILFLLFFYAHYYIYIYTLLFFYRSCPPPSFCSLRAWRPPWPSVGSSAMLPAVPWAPLRWFFRVYFVVIQTCRGCFQLSRFHFLCCSSFILGEYEVHNNEFYGCKYQVKRILDHTR